MKNNHVALHVLTIYKNTIDISNLHFNLEDHSYLIHDDLMTVIALGWVWDAQTTDTCCNQCCDFSCHLNG